jgi:hypothetical protein
MEFITMSTITQIYGKFWFHHNTINIVGKQDIFFMNSKSNFAFGVELMYIFFVNISE